MAAADLVWGADGKVAWNQVWDDFCNLAMAGGPPHRSTLLEPPAPEDVLARPDDQSRVLDELSRALHLVTGWPVRRDASSGWIGLDCPDDDAAVWLLRAILTENVAAWREGSALYLPAGPNFRVGHEIMNVVTAVAKTHHDWSEHAAVVV